MPPSPPKRPPPGESPDAAEAELVGAPRDPFHIHWRERIAVLGTTLAAAAAAAAVGLLAWPAATVELLALLPATFFAAGKFLPIWGITGQSQFGPYELGLVIWALDTVTVIVIVYGLQLLYRIRPLERGLERVHARAGLVLAAYPRMRRAALAGVFCFVLFPIAGTGAIGATFIGILLGIHRVVLIIIVSAGGLAGGVGMAVAAANFRQQVLELETLQTDPTLKYAIIFVAALSLSLFLWWASRLYHRAVESARDPGADTPPDP